MMVNRADSLKSTGNEEVWNGSADGENRNGQREDNTLVGTLKNISEDVEGFAFRPNEPPGQ